MIRQLKLHKHASVNKRIKSIKKTAEKYGGSYSWFYDDKNREFHAMVMLPISSESC